MFNVISVTRFTYDKTTVFHICKRVPGNKKLLIGFDDPHARKSLVKGERFIRAEPGPAR
jgi:hypothetical protein